MEGRHDLEIVGGYRIHAGPMQVVSGPIHHRKVHFEAPPSSRVREEMAVFLQWYNNTAPTGPAPLPALTRASIAHLYFVSIHPFEDGNGRIARALALRCLSQSLGQPVLIAMSQIIFEGRKTYYQMLERSNKDNKIDMWIRYFSETLLEAQTYSLLLIDFVIAKTKFLDRHRSDMNERQMKVILRILREGPSGFKGGLRVKNYLTITQTSRATATRDLQDLVDKGILDKEGILKGRRYRVSI